MSEDSPTLSDIEAFVRHAAEIVAASDLTSIEVERGDTRILVSREQSANPYAQANQAAATSQEPPQAEATQPDLTFSVTAPMIGTFYSAASPGEPPLVQPGERIESGQVVGIIEAMKIMNEIVADRAGVVEEILVANAQTVEYGQPLMHLSPLPAE